MHTHIISRMREKHALQQVQEMMENSMMMFRDTFMWAIIILLALFLMGFLLSLQSQESMNLELVPTYPFIVT